MMTTVSLTTICHHKKIYNCDLYFHTVHFIPMTHLFCNWKLIPLTSLSPVLLLLLPTPLWQVPVCFLNLWLVPVCRIYIYIYICVCVYTLLPFFTYSRKKTIMNERNRFFFYTCMKVLKLSSQYDVFMVSFITQASIILWLTTETQAV